MTAEQLEFKQKPPATQPRGSTRSRTPARLSKWGWLGLLAIMLALAGVATFGFVGYGREQSQKNGAAREDRAGSQQTNMLKVKVIKPQRGGMARVTRQPGTIRAFEFAPLYTKVSGFVKTLNVDRGSQVKKGDVLAEIYDPERDVAVIQAEAALEHSNAVVEQARASISTAKASVQAALAKQNEAKATLDQMTAQRNYRKKEYERISDLVARRSAEERLKDEELDHYHSAEAAVLSAEAGIETAAAELAEANAKVEKAEADLKADVAQVQIAKANLQMANVFVDYEKIRSPYEGFVIFRGEAVHPGSFIRAANEGGTDQPLLTVAYVKKMRTIVPVPDNQVPYCRPGNPATVTLDALAGREFKGEISRVAESEDLNDRTMRVEIDLDNPDGVLRDGMFGRATILLEKIIKNLTIPSSCFIRRNGKGEGEIMAIRDGKVHRLNVHVGMDNGLRSEIVDGLKDDDLVVLQPDASVADGTAADVEIVAPDPEKDASKDAG
jgi:RND family efflux transporter MFP subunit